MKTSYQVISLCILYLKIISLIIPYNLISLVALPQPCLVEPKAFNDKILSTVLRVLILQLPLQKLNL